MAPRDPYLLPNGTLINKLGITNAAELQRAETAAAQLRIAHLDQAGLSGPFDFNRLKATHGYIFGDVYPWAGESRSIGIVKTDFSAGGRGTVFSPVHRIAPIADVIFSRLAADRELKGLDRDTFIPKLTDYFSQVNILHPFREGNGRTQEAFFTALARDAGHPIDLSGITQERMVRVSVDAARGELSPMRHMFAEAADPRSVAKLSAFIDFLKAARSDWNSRYIAMTEPGRSYHGTFGGVSNDRETFFMIAKSDIYIGWTKDIPGNVLAHAPVSFKAGDPPPPRPAPNVEAKPGTELGIRQPPKNGLER